MKITYDRMPAMRWPALIVIAALGLAACEPVPSTIRADALNWIAAYQAQQGDVEAALETAALARLTADLTDDLEVEYDKGWGLQAAAPALAWAGDNVGAEHVAIRHNVVRGPHMQLSALGNVAIAHARAGHRVETKRISGLILKAVEESGKGGASAIVALALAWSGDFGAAREIAMRAGRSSNDWSGLSLVALAQAQAGDFSGARATVDDIPETGKGAGTDDLLYQIALGVDIPVAVDIWLAKLPGKVLAWHDQALLWVAWQDAKRGAGSAVETAGKISDPARRASALALIALRLADAGSDAEAARAAGLARELAKNSKYVDALTRAATGDVAGALEAAGGLGKDEAENLIFQITLSQALSGDIEGAVRTAERLGKATDRVVPLALILMFAGEDAAEKSNELKSALAAVSKSALAAVRTESDPLDRWLLLAVEAVATAHSGNPSGAVAMAAGIADQRTRGAAEHVVAVAQGAAGDFDAARQTIEGIDENFRGRAAGDALLAAGRSGAVEEAVVAVRTLDLFAFDDALAVIANASARAGDAAGARLAAAAAADEAGPETELSVAYAALAEAAAGSLGAATDLVKKGSLDVGRSVRARMAAGGDGLVEDLIAFQRAIEGSEIGVVGEFSFSAGSGLAIDLYLLAPQLLAELGEREHARNFAIRAHEAAKGVPELSIRDRARVAALLALTGERNAAETILDKAIAENELAKDAETRDWNRGLIIGALAALGRREDALSMTESIAMPDQRIDALQHIALALAARGMLDEAFEIAGRIGDLEARAKSLGEIASRRAVADPAGARRAGELAAAAAAGLLDAHARAVALSDSARTQTQIGDSTGARQTARIAFDGAARIRLPELRALSLGVAAESLAAAGAVEEARRAVALGRAASAAIGAGFYRALALSQLARAQAREGDRAAARDLANLAAEAAATIPD